MSGTEGQSVKTRHSVASRTHFGRFLTWRKIHISDSGFVLALSFVIGICTGVCAFVLKLFINTIADTLCRRMHPESANWAFIILPVIGIVLTGLFCRYILRADVSNGVKKLVDDLKNRNYALSPKTIYGSVFASSLTLGFGGSAGSEGPIAYAGAGIGSRIGRYVHLTPRMVMILIGCGAGAGIAGIFKAPVGGALFVLEVLRIELSTLTVLGVFLACVTSSFVAYSLSGFTLDINVVSPGVFDTGDMLWLLPLGLICGLYSLYYTYTGKVAQRLLGSLGNRWAEYLCSGLTLGVMIFLFPALYGEGYGTISDIINGHVAFLKSSGPFSQSMMQPATLTILLCIGILAFKGIGASAANNGGGVAGDFAPTLFAGCILGLLFASVSNTFFSADLNAAHFALIAMAGGMAGIIRAPFMSMFLVTEMIGGFLFLLPCAIVAVISYGIVMIFTGETFYHSRPFREPPVD